MSLGGDVSRHGMWSSGWRFIPVAAVPSVRSGNVEVLAGDIGALLMGWVMPRKLVERQLEMARVLLESWLVAARVVAPAGVMVIFLYTLYRAVAG